MVLLGFVVFRVAQQQRTLDTQGRDVLAMWLAAEYTRRALAAVPATGVDSAAAARLAEARRVGFRSLTARGHGDDVVVRAEVTVAGGPPPDGRSVRYFQMSHSLILGWHYDRETTAFFYHTRLW